MRPGGAAFVIDNDATRSTFGGGSAARCRATTPAPSSGSGQRQGWHASDSTSAGTSPPATDLEAVVGIEFAPELADLILAGHPGTGVDYAVNLFWRTYP